MNVLLIFFMIFCFICFLCIAHKYKHRVSIEKIKSAVIKYLKGHKVNISINNGVVIVNSGDSSYELYFITSSKYSVRMSFTVRKYLSELKNLDGWDESLIANSNSLYNQQVSTCIKDNMVYCSYLCNIRDCDDFINEFENAMRYINISINDISKHACEISNSKVKKKIGFV